MNEKTSWKIPVYLLLFGLLTFFGVFFKNFGTRTYSAAEVRGGDSNLELFTQPEAGRQPILDAINSAQKEILVEVYLLSDKQIITSLIEAKNRGVKVKIMIEEHPFGGGNINSATARRLQDEGVDFKWTNPTFALTHEKAIVVDQTTAFILNQNLTKSSFKSNREFNIIDHNAADVSEVMGIFMADWNRSGFNPSSSNLIVSPDNARGKLTTLISSGTKSLDLELEILQDRDMINLLSDLGDKITVRIIIPSFSKVPSNRTNAENLKSAGVEIRTINNPYVHAKLIIVDQSHAYLGSVNMSDASMDQNRELGILIAQENIIDQLNQNFESDWSKALSF